MKDFPCEIEIYAKESLKRHNLKATPQRLAVLHVLHTNTGFIEIDKIHEEVKNLLPKTGLATIYRTLECLEGIGLILMTQSKNGKYYYNVSGESGGHCIVCTECNKVIELDECYLDNYLGAIEKNTGFEVQTHFLQVYGQCGECIRI